MQTNVTKSIIYVRLSSPVWSPEIFCMTFISFILICHTISDAFLCNKDYLSPSIYKLTTVSCYAAVVMVIIELSFNWIL